MLDRLLYTDGVLNRADVESHMEIELWWILGQRNVQHLEELHTCLTNETRMVYVHFSTIGALTPSGDISGNSFTSVAGNIYTTIGHFTHTNGPSLVHVIHQLQQ